MSLSIALVCLICGVLVCVVLAESSSDCSQYIEVGTGSGGTDFTMKCIGCNADFTLTTQNSLDVCQSNCGPLQFYQNNNIITQTGQKCASQCSIQEFPMESTKSCEQIQQCPVFATFGQSFHTNPIDKLLLSSNEILTLSTLDKFILAWDISEGVLRTEFAGHSSPVLGMEFITKEVFLTFSTNEIIIWNYSTTTIKELITITSGHFTATTAINSAINEIISYGYFGEFFLIDYQTQTYLKYTGHTNIVENVYFVQDTHVISVSKDGLMLLWEIKNNETPLTLIVGYYNTKLIVFYPLLNGSYDRIFVAALGSSIPNQNPQVIEFEITKIIIDSSELASLAIHVLIDSTYINLDISVSAVGVIASINTDTIFISAFEANGLTNQYAMKETHPSAALTATSSAINSVIASVERLFVSFKSGEIAVYRNACSMDIGLPQTTTCLNFDMLYDTQKQCSACEMVYASDIEKLFVFENNVSMFDLGQNKLILDIGNLPSPVIRHQNQITTINIQAKSQIIASISLDSYVIVYDYLDLSIVQVLYHPDASALGSSSDPIPIAVAIVLGQDVCVSYSNRSFVCYDTAKGTVSFIVRNLIENYHTLQDDKSVRQILCAGESNLVVYDLVNHSVVASVMRANSFYHIRFIFALSKVFGCSKTGYFTRYSYPNLSYEIELDQTASNPQGQVIKDFYFDPTVTQFIAFFDNGLVFIDTFDLAPFKVIQYTEKISLCVLFYPTVAMCGTNNGKIVVWGLFVNLFSEKQILDFPVVSGLFSAKSSKLFLLVDYSTFGSAILVGDSNTLLAEHVFETEKKISAIQLDDDRQRVVSGINNGMMNLFQFTPGSAKMIQWKLSGSTSQMQKIILLEEMQNLVIIGDAFTIYDYFNSAISRTRTLKSTPPTGTVVDKNRKFLIAYYPDTTDNLLLWDFSNDTLKPLIQHTDAVLGVFIRNSDGNLVSYGKDGTIIFQNYLTGELKRQITPHGTSNSVLSVIIAPVPGLKDILISHGSNNQIVLIDLSTFTTNSIIHLPGAVASIRVDQVYQRIFVAISNTIIVYSYITGLKVTELLGFDALVELQQGMIFEGDYIIAHGTYKIASFNRSSLLELNEEISTQIIYRMSVIQSIVALISDSVNDVIKVWNYKTGVMLQDMTNLYYPIPINGILADRDANTYFVRNTKNNIFIFNPYLKGISKIQEYMMFNTFGATYPILDILFDKQSNLLFAYSAESIMIWKYYAFLGKKGQEKTLPSSSLLRVSYQSAKDMLIFSDRNKNIWSMQDNQVTLSTRRQEIPRECIVIGETLVLLESDKIVSFNSKYYVISSINIPFGERILFSKTEPNLLFVITQTQDLYVISVNQSTHILTESVVFNHVFTSNAADATQLTRFTEYTFNPDFKHLIISNLSGVVVVIHYGDNTIVSTLKPHTNRIRKLLVSTEISLLFSCSIDGSVVNFNYSEYSVSIKTTMPLTESIEEIAFDPVNSRLLVWQNLISQIQILDAVNLTVLSHILSPGEVDVSITVCKEYNMFTVHNLFQVNIYRLTEDYTFISRIRSPSEMQSIERVEFLSESKVLIISTDGIRIYSFTSVMDTAFAFDAQTYSGSSSSAVSSTTSQSSVTQTLLQSHSMDTPTLMKYSYDQSLGIMNLKGVNYQKAFNYTYFLTDSPKNITCYTSIEDPRDYFDMKREIINQETSLSSYIGSDNLSGITVKYNMIYKPFITQQKLAPMTIFFPATSKTNTYSISVVFQTHEFATPDGTPEFYKARVLVDLTNPMIGYPLSQLILNSYFLYLPTRDDYSTPIGFNAITKHFLFTNGILQQIPNRGPLKLVGLLFSNITSFVLEEFYFLETQFVMTVDDLNLKLVVEIDSSDSVLIKNLIIKNCEFQDSTVFRISFAKVIQIQNVIIENVKFTLKSATGIPSIFHILNSQTVTIKNIQVSSIMSNAQPFNIFRLECNKITSISNIQMTQTINVQLLLYLQSYSKDDLYYKVTKDQISIENVSVSDSTQSQVAQENGKTVQTLDSVMHIESYLIDLKGIVTSNTYCGNCYGASLYVDSFMLSITYSSFASSQAIQGGALYMKNCKKQCIISYVQFSNNYANSGGAIFLYNSDVLLSHTIFEMNAAKIGGALRYIEFIPEQLQDNLWRRDNNTFTDNTADIFGSNFGSYPRSVELTFAQERQVEKYTNLNSELTTLQMEQNYRIKQFMSGDKLEIQLKILDEEGEKLFLTFGGFVGYPEEIADEVYSYYFDCFSNLQTIGLNSETMINKSKFNMTRYSFDFDDLIITGRPNSTSSFQIKSNTIQLYQKANQGFLTPTYIANLEIEFRSCQIGEIYMESQAGLLEYCKKCGEGTYSLVDPGSQPSANVRCQVCPDNAKFCKENLIILKNGYWRESNSTDIIVECTNAPQNCQDENPESINSCKTGYVGPLCETCDLEGIIWGKPYSQTRKYECADCGDMSWQYVVYAMAFFLVILYVCYGVYQANKVSMRKILGYYLRMMGVASVGRTDSEDEASVYLKILMHYLYISSIIKKSKLIEFSAILEFIQLQIGSPVDSMKSAPDCYYRYINSSMKTMFQRQIATQIIPLLYLFAISIGYLILVSIRFIQHKRNNVLSGLVFLFIFIQPDMISGIISASSCRSIGGKTYVAEDLTEVCFTKEHLTFLVSFCLPFFIVWAIILPIAIFYRIYQLRGNLNFIFPRICYGFIYQEYRPQAYYWEFVKMALKVLITLANNFLKDDENLKLALTCIFIVVYLLLAMKSKPFLSKSFNEIDRRMHIVLIFIMLISVVGSSEQYILVAKVGVVIFFAMHWMFMLQLIMSIFKSNIQIAVVAASHHFPKLLDSHSYLFRYFNVRPANRMPTFKRWRFVWNCVFREKIFSKKVKLMETEFANQQQSQKQMLQESQVTNQYFNSFEQVRMLENSDFSKSLSSVQPPPFFAFNSSAKMLLHRRSTTSKEIQLENNQAKRMRTNSKFKNLENIGIVQSDLLSFGVCEMPSPKTFSPKSSEEITSQKQLKKEEGKQEKYLIMDLETGSNGDDNSMKIPPKLSLAPIISPKYDPKVNAHVPVIQEPTLNSFSQNTVMTSELQSEM